MKNFGLNFSRRRFINHLFGASLATNSLWGKPSQAESDPECDMTIGAAEGDWLLKSSTFAENDPEKSRNTIFGTWSVV